MFYIVFYAGNFRCIKQSNEIKGEKMVPLIIHLRGKSSSTHCAVRAQATRRRMPHTSLLFIDAIALFASSRFEKHMNAKLYHMKGVSAYNTCKLYHRKMASHAKYLPDKKRHLGPKIKKFQERRALRTRVLNVYFFPGTRRISLILPQ